MATATTANTGGSNLMSEYYVPVALEVMESNLVLDQFADQNALIRSEGKVVWWNRFDDLGYGEVITEGTNPTAIGLSTAKLSATIRQKGRVEEHTELLDFTSVCPITENVTRRMAYSAAKTLDACVFLTFLRPDATQYDALGDSAWQNPSGFIGGVYAAAKARGISVLLSGLSTWEGTRALSAGASLNQGFTGTGSLNNIFRKYMTSEMSGTATTVADLSSVIGQGIGGPFPLKAKDVYRAVEKLEEFDIKRFPDGYYVGVINAANKRILTTDTAWKDAYMYTNPGNMYRGEAGMLAGVRFVQSEALPTWDISGITHGAARLHMTPFFGQGAFGNVKKDGGLTMTHVPVGTSDHSDVLGLKGQVGYLLEIAPVVLNKSAGVIVVSTTKR